MIDPEFAYPGLPAWQASTGKHHIRAIMIDSIVLTLSKDMFQITDPDKFMPSARWALAEHTASNNWITSKQNPTIKELRQGIYKPHLTLSRRMNMQGRPEIMLRIELSLPKLMFGNNFNELQYKDFAAVCTKLVANLQTMGVTTTPNHLAYAPVVAIHYSKNIVLTDGSTPYHYINKIKEANVKLSLDVNQTDYHNDGHCFKWHANSYEVVFYDKIRDLEKAQQSNKRALEKDSALQLHLFDKLKKRKKLEVLRMEARLNKRQKMKQLFTSLAIKSDLTFKSLYKPAISKKVLLHYIDEIISKRCALLDVQIMNDKSFLTSLIVNNRTLSPLKILQMYGLKCALNVINIRELRTMLGQHSKNAGWYRLMKDTQTIKLPTPYNPFETIREQLVKFNALKI